MSTYHRQISKFALAPTHPTDQIAEQILNREALRRAGYVFLASLGIGAGARGGLGLLNQLNASSSGKKVSPHSPHPEVVPFPAAEEQDEEKQAAEARAWGLPLAWGAGMAGAGVGWTALDTLLKRQRRQLVEEELDEAREEFAKALSGQSKLGQSLDHIYDNVEKQGIDLTDKNMWLGHYLSYAMLSALLAGKMSYNKARARSPKSILDEAARMRKLRIAQQQPQPVLFAQHAAPPAPPAPAPGEQEEEEELESPTPALKLA